MDVSNSHFYFVISFEAVDGYRSKPASDEYPNDQITEQPKVIVEPANELPKAAVQFELFADQAERFDAADQDGDDN